MSELQTEYTALKTQINELQKQFRETAQKLFHETAQKLFTDHPELDSFGWTQYTPYFNDGDECTFSVNNDYPTLNKSNEEYSWRSLKRSKETGLDWNKQPYTLTALDEAAIAVGEFLDGFPDDLMKTMFGDHMRVTIYRDGKVSTREYDHD